MISRTADGVTVPDWVHNQVTVSGNPEDVATVSAVRGTAEDGSDVAFDFERVVPLPDGVEVTNELCNRHWGTKWDAQALDVFHDKPGLFGVEFDRPWSPPESASRRWRVELRMPVPSSSCSAARPEGAAPRTGTPADRKARATACVACRAPLVARWLLGVGLPAGSESGELAAVAALRARATLSDAAWELVHQTVTTPLSRDLAQQPPDRSTVTKRWTSWLTGEHEDPVLRDAGPALLGLVTAGVLPRVTGMATSAPGWARLAAADIDVVSRATALLGEPPVSGIPSGLSDWSAIAPQP